MKFKNSTLTLLIGTCIAVTLAFVVMAWAQEQGKLLLPQDKGPDKLDVSSYPKPIQDDYKVFAEKCPKCHTLARGLNTMMTQDEWSRYVKRMMHKPNSGINESQGKQIFDFLVYDETNRKDKDPKSFNRSLTDEELEKLKAGEGH